MHLRVMIWIFISIQSAQRRITSERDHRFGLGEARFEANVSTLLFAKAAWMLQLSMVISSTSPLSPKLTQIT